MTLDEEDLALVQALQIRPRGSWTAVANALDRSPTALSSRWSRLRREGLAWVTIHPVVRTSSTQMAFIDVDCVHTERDRVVDELCRVPEVLSLELSARGRDLLLTVVASSWEDLSRLVLTRLQISGVVRHRTSLVTEIHRTAGDWRLDALTSAQTEVIRLADATSVPGAGPATTVDTTLVEHLVRDGRLSFAELARLTGRTPATVRRQLARLDTSGLVRFRCDVSQQAAGWPISCTWFCRVDPHHIAETTQMLGRIPEVRGCMSTTGESNLLFVTWTRSVHDLLRIEKHVVQSQPSLRLLDSAVALSTPKRLGWLLDPWGSATGEVVAPSF